MKVIECFETFKGDDDDMKFDHWATILSDGTDSFKVKSPRELEINQDIDIAEFDCPPVRIPIEDLWPPLEEEFTLVSQPIPDNAFQKIRSLMHWDPPPSSLQPRDIVLHEVKMCELLQKHPHKNIATYLGCISEGGLIKGLCFVRYEESLSDRLGHPDRPLNISECLKGIKDGLDHLHSLGLNHNDVNPRNIMLDKDDVPIIIDFDSCEVDGGIPLCCGTPGWTEGEQIDKSERRNDDFGLEQIRLALLGLPNSNSKLWEAFRRDR